MSAIRARVHARDLAALKPQPKRGGLDWWATPNCLTRALLDHVLPELPPAAIWEPAAGDERLSEAIRGHGRAVLASDLLPRAAMLRHDFLRDEPPAETLGAIAVSNPPFNASNAFISRGLALLDSGVLSAVVLLLRSDALAAGNRARALNRAAILWQCCWRPRWIENSTGSGRWSNTWCCWLAERSGPPIIHFLPRPACSGDLFDASNSGNEITQVTP